MLNNVYREYAEGACWLLVLAYNHTASTPSAPPPQGSTAWRMVVTADGNPTNPWEVYFREIKMYVGDEQVSGPCVAQPIVSRLQQRAIRAEFACSSPVLLWCVPGILCVTECWRFFGAKLDHSNPFKPMPSIPAY